MKWETATCKIAGDGNKVCSKCVINVHYRDNFCVMVSMLQVIIENFINKSVK